MEGREIQASAKRGQNQKGDQQKPRARVGHDQEQNPGLAGLLLLVFEADQAIGGKRHHLPGDQEEERVRRREDERQTEQQNVVEEAQNADVLSTLPVPQIPED